MHTKAGRPVAFAGIAKRYGSFEALSAIDIALEPGEFLALLGPSGSGKTTLLNIAAGFVAPSAGRVVIAGQDVTPLPPRKRNIGMMFQSYALFPHLSVFENVAYGLRVRNRPRAEVAERVEAALAMVQLDGLGQRRIRGLSGGQQQRVALARAVVTEPDVLLMDEPLGALDRQLRKHVQLEIRRLHRALGCTTVFVTHDQEEALMMADRVGVMRAGRLEQVGSPRDLYARPANAFVAAFLGESNLLRGRVTRCEGGAAAIDLPALRTTLRGRAARPFRVGEEAAALLRPETLSFAPHGGFRGRVEETIFLGEIFAARVELAPGQSVWVRTFSSGDQPAEGAQTTLACDPAAILILPADPT
ncbi:spermidine/putrescine ABC transporter ATPase subunit [Methylobacterium sp. 4-46]|uniref:ABC transporter ATP-binding protein n=1 Tax=unclassified Methylobacterium TaxID=2615210 RepID=UPI000152D70A|nr:MULTISPECIES: ABC transporter ATP-binding protein [Methylobacterium]ACA18236.1 spermidine/putrescine ABC transporter ATPase subunit [Methylobacterium sp. 4-46]WFT83607.1 ABC transporter ATP-binding protein [Methylobacterium nodulans]